MYEHLHWANLRILKTLQSSEDAGDQVKRLFSHILLTEQVWLSRIESKAISAPPLWDELSIEECSKLVEHNNNRFTKFLGGLSDLNIDNLKSYKNSTGREFTTSVRDILTHIALHGHYHRGQINQLLRAAGFEPVNIDFITFTR